VLQDIAQGDYQLVGQVQLSETGMPLFLHRTSANKLRLDIPVYEVPRPVALTSITTYKLTHGHLHWDGQRSFHTLAAGILVEDLDCENVDDWLLAAWHEHPTWIPLRSRSALDACLRSYNLTVKPYDHSHTEKAAVIPVESFGERVVMAINLQHATLGYLRLKHEDMLVRNSSRKLR